MGIVSDNQMLEDLRMLVVQLGRALEKAVPGNNISYRALDFLKRKGLTGTPLRAQLSAQSPADGDIGMPIDTIPEGEYVELFIAKGESDCGFDSNGNCGMGYWVIGRYFKGNTGIWTFGGPNGGIDWDEINRETGKLEIPTHWRHIRNTYPSIAK